MIVNKVFTKYYYRSTGMTSVVWALPYKPTTNDMCDVPNRVIGHPLLSVRVCVNAHEPVIEQEAR
jgi:UDP-glucose 6-dehydrogenase